MRSQAQQNPSSTFSQYQSLVEKRDWHKAYVHLKQILWDDPSHPIALDHLGQLTNKISMVALKQQNYQLAEQFLRKSIRYSRHSPYLTLVTYNNWSCYYKKTSNNAMALLAIEKAMALARHIEQTEHMAGTDKIKYIADSYLNLCAVLSQMGEHKMALENARIAVGWLEREGKGKGKGGRDRENVMAIARYNLAVELEHLKRFEEAKEAYQLLWNFMKEWEENSNPLLKKVEKALQSLDIRSKSLGNRRSSSRNSSTQNRHRLRSLFKLEPSNVPSSHQTISTYLDKQVDVAIPTTPHHTLNLKRVLQQRSTNNNTALSTLSHTRSHTSERPSSGKLPIGHRRTMTKFLPMKGRLSELLD